MNTAHVILLLAAGLAAGTVNAIAGGGSLITFPALIATGLGTIAANVTNSISVCPGYFASVYGSRQELAGQWGRAARLLPASVLGSLAGAELLLHTPARAFDLVVPFLVLGAAAMLAFQQRLRGLVGHPHAMSRRRRAWSLQVMTLVGAVYGGYFGAALGVMLVAALALVLDETMARVGALKNVISAAVGSTTVVVFALFGPVNWVDVAILAPATIAGGYLGARLARRLPAQVLRWTIVAFGTAIGIWLLVKAL